MIYKILLSVALSFTLIGCGSSRDGSSTVQGSNGVVTLSGDAVVGGALSASISDEDGVNAGTDSYQWFSDGDQITGATSSSYALTADEGSESVTAVVRYTDAAGLRETVTSSPMDIQAAFNLGLMFIHGLVDGASCEIFAVDASGVASSAALGAGTTTNGIADFGGLIPVDGTALISCSGGTFTSESTGLSVDAPDTRAIVNVDTETTFTVSPLTEIATQLAEMVGDLNTALSVHNMTVARLFGISGDITEIEPTDLMVTAANDDDEGRYATALVLIAQLDANDIDNSTAEVVDTLADDLTDGELSQVALDDLNQAIVDLGTSTVSANLNSTVIDQVENAVNNAPEPASFEGLSATMPNDQIAALEGSVIVTDVNFGEDQVTPQAETQTTYGSFSIDADGTWSYTLDTFNEAVAGLEVGGSVNDTIAITSADGTAANLVIRVTALTQVAEITNTINGDTGELRFNLVEHQLQGKLSFSFMKTIALADDGNDKDAYITLYGTSGSSSEALIDLRIQGQETLDDQSIREPRFFVRNTDSDAYPDGIIEAPFTPGEWYDIEMMWDMSQDNQITVLINGEALGGGAFSTAAVVDTDFTDLNQWFSEGVERVQWRFGDNGTVIPFGSYFVDNIELYSDAAGTSLVYMDDFEGNNVGDLLAGSYPDSVDATVAVFDVGTAGEPVPAAFFNLVGAIDSDSTDTLMDTVSVIDPDAGEALLVEQVGTTTDYGTFSIMPSGDWDYDLDTANETVAAMVLGDRITDTIQISSIDGTTAELVITINGVGGAPTGDNNVAVIVDTSATDTGELRYELASDGPLAAGRLELKIKRLDDDLGDGDAFINLYNENTNNDGAILDFRIRDSSFGVRSPSTTDTSSLPLTLDAFMDVVVIWDYPNGLDMLPEVTITVDGVSLPTYTTDNDAYGGVTHIAVRFGDNGGIRADTGKVTIDDLAIYSDTAGTTEIFSDDFESYLEGDSLDTDNGASPYNSSTSEAVVETIAGASGPGTPGNKFAAIVDTIDTDTGELRYELADDGPLAAGRLEVAVKRLDDDLGDGDVFISLFNEDTNNDGAILDLRIRDNNFEVRSPGTVDTSALTVVLGTFMDVVVTWEYPGGDTSLNPEVTLSVDGVSLPAFTTDNSAFLGVTHVSFRFGDNGGIRAATGIVSIDDLAIYSDTAGTTEVFSDDFESYLENDSLDTDNGASPYASNTSEATVGVEAAVGGPGTPGNKFAAIVDTIDTDTGELRYELAADGPLAAGRLEVALKRLDDDLGDGDVFISLFNEDTNNDGAILDLRIRDNNFEVRSPGTVDTSALTVVLGTFMDVVVTWEYPGGDTSLNPEVTLSVDGVSLPTFTTDNSAFLGVTHVSFRFGDNGGIRAATGIVSIDDLAIYSDTAGATEVFSDDFESYLENDSLDTDNGASPYASNTSEATVGVEE